MNVDWLTFWPRIVEATGETLIMVIATLVFGSIFGIAIGLLLFVRQNNILENKLVSQILNIVINIVRPVPFITSLSSHFATDKISCRDNNRNSGSHFPDDNCGNIRHCPSC